MKDIKLNKFCIDECPTTDVNWTSLARFAVTLGSVTFTKCQLVVSDDRSIGVWITAGRIERGLRLEIATAAVRAYHGLTGVDLNERGEI